MSITPSTHTLQSLHAPALHPKTLKPKHPHEHTTQPPLPLLPALRINIQHDPALHTLRLNDFVRERSLLQHTHQHAHTARILDCNRSTERDETLQHHACNQRCSSSQQLARSRQALAAGALRRNVRTITRSTFEGEGAIFFAGKCGGDGWGGGSIEVRCGRCGGGVSGQWRDLHLLVESQTTHHQ